MVYSKTFEEHLHHPKLVTGRFGDARVDCVSGQYNVRPIVNLGGVTVDPARTQRIRDFSPSNNVYGVSRFLGIEKFYCRFILKAAEFAVLFYELRNENFKFVCGEM